MTTPSRRDRDHARARLSTRKVRDYGLSGELTYDFGAAELTSITAYRYNKYTRGSDADYNNLDILYRASDGGSFNRFKTFTEELRLQGNASDNRLDWLVGGYYANEKLAVDDNLAYGDDYARYGNCLVAANFAPAAPTSLAPGASPTCFNTAVATGVRSALVAQYNAALAASQFTTAANIGSNITALRRLRRSDSSTGVPLARTSGGQFQRGTVRHQRLHQPRNRLGGRASSARPSMAWRLTIPIGRPATTGRCSPTTFSRSPTG